MGRTSRLKLKGAAARVKQTEAATAATANLSKCRRIGNSDGATERRIPQVWNRAWRYVLFPSGARCQCAGIRHHPLDSTIALSARHWDARAEQSRAVAQQSKEIMKWLIAAFAFVSFAVSAQTLKWSVTLDGPAYGWATDGF